MTTFHDDMVKLDQKTWVPVHRLGLDWPPPRVLVLLISGGEAVVYERESCSEITDDERATMTNVFRGAQYISTPLSEVAVVRL